MRKIYFTIIILGLFLQSCTESLPENAVKAEFKVWGNCGMCKKTIEKSLGEASGVITASWDKDTKIMQLVYDTTATNLGSVQEAIAASGYDTPMHRGSDVAYANLHECCKYDRKK